MWVQPVDTGTAETDQGLVDRTILSEKPFRVEYSLPDRGHSLEPIITEMRKWGEQHLTAPDDDRPV